MLITLGVITLTLLIVTIGSVHRIFLLSNRLRVVEGRADLWHDRADAMRAKATRVAAQRDEARRQVITFMERQANPMQLLEAYGQAINKVVYPPRMENTPPPPEEEDTTFIPDIDSDPAWVDRTPGEEVNV